MSLEIVLEAGVVEVMTADVPGLIAAALHPDPSRLPPNPDDGDRAMSAEIAGMLRLQAEQVHQRGVVADIRAGRLAVIDPVSRRPADELHAGSKIRIEELRRYVAQWDIALRVAEPACEEISVHDLAMQIARGAANHHADQWTKPGRDNGLRGAIAAAMNAHGWQPDGIPSVLQHIRNMVEMGVAGFGPIHVRSRFNGLPPTDPDQIKENPANWLISSDHAEAVCQALEVEANRPKPSNDGYALNKYITAYGHQNSENWTREQWNRVVAEVAVLPNTLLTIGDAANFVGHKHGLHDQAIKTLCKQMMAAAGKLLIVRHPHTDLPYEPQSVRSYYELVRADDLDAWFEALKSSMRIQSPPNSESAGAVSHGIDGGLGRRAILGVDWPLFGKFTQESLGNALSDVPNWLESARVSTGKPGKRSSTWNPALIAECLAGKSHANRVALGYFLEKNFPQYHAQWARGEEI